MYKREIKQYTHRHTDTQTHRHTDTHTQKPEKGRISSFPAGKYRAVSPKLSATEQYTSLL